MSTNNDAYIKKNRVKLIDDDKNTRLHYAAALGHLQVVKEQLATEQKIDPENYLGWTPLMMAVRNGHKDVVDLLLNSRANATKQNRFGISVFLLSVTSGCMEILTIILEHLLTGGVSRQVLQKTISPVALAVMFGQSHIMKYLIARSFDINSATPLTGLTPLMFAAAVRNTKAYKRLIASKANEKLKNCVGKTAADIKQVRHQRVEVILDKKPKPPPIPLIMVNHQHLTPNTSPFILTPTPMINMNNINLMNQMNMSANMNQPELARKSSNIKTPEGIFCSPLITPITPNVFHQQQVFFPPNFTPSQYVSPNPVFQSNDILNAHITQSPYFSPAVPMHSQMCYPNNA